MDEIFEAFPNAATFDTYWNENYKELSYADVKEQYEDYVRSADKHIFLSDYEENKFISRNDFKDNLSDDAQFQFQDILTEVFYDKNPDLYETAFAIYESAKMLSNGKEGIAKTFHEEYNRLYDVFLMEMYDTFFAE